MPDESLDTYFCVDIEVDGFSPGHHSMMSFAAVAFELDKTVLGTLERNLLPLPGAKQDPDVMRFWADHPGPFAATQSNPVSPAEAMKDLRDWALTFPVRAGGERVLVAHPASLDHRFIDWYFEEAGVEDPFHFACLDLASYAMALLGNPFSKSNKKHLPVKWVDPTPHTHVAIDDAIGHARTFCNLVAAARNLRRAAQASSADLR